MHISILKRVGIVLILVGAFDIAFMVWCITNGRSYSSSLNIFALVAGILLVRSGLKTARWVATISSFMLVACAGLLIVMPFIFPIGYWLAVLRSGVAAPSIVVALLLLALLYWVRQQTLRPEVLEAQRAAGLSEPRTKRAMGFGFSLSVLLVPLLGFTLHGATAHQAIEKAKQQLGGNYRYVVTSMGVRANTKGTSVFAIVAAYNDTELKSIPVSWQK